MIVINPGYEEKKETRMDESISSVHRTKQDARANYDRLSRWYDLIAGSSEAKYRQIGVRALDLQPGERVLEIGFGTGHCLEAFARAAGVEGWVCGIDLSEGMAFVTQGLLDSVGLPGRVSLIVGDGAYIPISSGNFDAVFMSFTLELFDTPEISIVLSECKRILRPGGRLGVVSLEKHIPPTFAEKVYECFHHRMPVLVDCRPIQLQDVLLDAGFVFEQVTHEKMWGLPVGIIVARPG
jgi:ubiquinone/menaquinone biosynthesis C-methylase UbiE